ncbi:O-antigen ligase family protein [Motilimonas eburnea]|uniref:O-antigen ligase family protein n=1 Tax=Motilimonas eburnea TaxID=1737488 RepID=UPI001E4CC344|nr:O-antigen ligase family protein [Motilimonas eburnea]MCE2572620.1 O-antigen ligase family protein [Motilimonas eburnea]
MAVLVAIACLIACIYRSPHVSLDAIKGRLCHPFVLLILIYTVFAIASYTSYGYSSREMRALIATCVLLVFVPLDWTRCKAWLAPLLIVSSVGALVYLLINVHILHLGRASWSINAIPFATYCAALALLAGGGLLTAQNRQQKIFFAISFCLSVIAVFYSQTRGIWLALGVALVILFANQFRHLRVSRQTFIVVAITGVLALTLIGPKVSQRYQQTVKEYQAIQGGNYNTSIGLRFQMWQAAVKLAPISPILGHGDDHANQLRAMHQADQVSSHLIRFNPAHYHNQFLDKLVKGGGVGLGLLITLLLLPVWLSRGQPQHKLALCLSALFALASLTDVPFNHPQIAYLYFIVMAILLIGANEKSPVGSGPKRQEASHA